MNSDSTPNKQTENNVVTLTFSIYPDLDISSNESKPNIPDKPTYNNGKIIINDTLFYKIKTINSYDTCPITFESISDSDIVSKIINCGHYFKPESLHKWCEKNTTCPVCRCNIGNTIISNSQRHVINDETEDDSDMWDMGSAGDESELESELERENETEENIPRSARAPVIHDLNAYDSYAYNHIRRTSRTIIQPSMATSSLSSSRVLF